MTNINLKLYFNISNFLKNKKDKDFIKYKNIFYEKYKIFDEKKKLEYLIDYYQTQSNKKDENYKIFENISYIKKVILISFFILGMILTSLFFDKEINVNLYLIVSVGLPLIYFIYLSWEYFRYRFPTKPEKSILSWFLKKKFKNFNEQHSHILKTYSTMLGTQLSISYTIGVLISTIIIFSVFNVTFYSETTYGANDYNITTTKYTKDINQSNKNIKINKKQSKYSSAYYSRFITLILILMISLKTIFYIFARRDNRKTINLALIHQGDIFFQSLKPIINIGLEKEDIKNNSNNKKKIRDVIQKQNNIDLKDYYILYYEIEKDNIYKIEFNISNHPNLKNKLFKSYTYGLFDKEDEDIKTLHKLNNLVVIYTSAETIPDETFQDNILDIIKTDVNDIWIIPLKDNGNKLDLLKKDDKDYNKWETIITKINNNHIRIHFDL